MLVSLGVFLLCVPGVQSFEIFAEQQVVTMNDPSIYVDYNNSEYGTTHIDDYWSKIDINYSPIEGWSLFRHVRIGCFRVDWEEAPPGAFVEKVGEELTDMDCVKLCNRSQTFYHFGMRESVCRCEMVPDRLIYEAVTEDGCPPDAWEVFREYDYRTSMSPSTYDVPRRLVYQIVTMRVPNVVPSLQYWIHAVNALEAKPKFEFDTRLERMVFNAVWDFGAHRMVALSFRDWNTPLDFTIVKFNTSLGALVVTQEHFPLQSQIEAVGTLLGTDQKGMASVDGLSTVDILWGTYYTVVPAVTSESTQVVHVIVAIDIEKRSVINSITLPVTLMNLQINCLTHVVYGAASDIYGRFAYYELCKAINVTRQVGQVKMRFVEVSCDTKELLNLPNNVRNMYLQSASIDHQYDYAWFIYKKAATGRPIVFEMHHEDKDYKIWREESLPLEAAFTSLIQTAPRIIFSLYPPTFTYARFAPSGTKIYLAFNTPTLRGAIPRDNNGDEIPDYWRDEDEKTRLPCSEVFDDFTMKLLGDSMCQWQTDASFFIELSADATVVPGDLIRLRPGRIYAGRRTPGGLSLFSQPSTDFAIVQPPEYIPIPVVKMSGNWYLDVCTELVLDATASTGHGFRGTFLWSLNYTIPATSEPHVRMLEKILYDLQPVGQTQQMVRIPPNTLLGDHKYFFRLKVVSFWSEDVWTEVIKMVSVSSLAVPPLIIHGPQNLTVSAANPVTLVSRLGYNGGQSTLNSGCADITDPTVQYFWTGGFATNATPMLGGIDGIPGWNPEVFGSKLELITGVGSKSLYIMPYVLEPLVQYMFTITAHVILNQGTPSEQILKNQASVYVQAILEKLKPKVYGSTNGFSASRASSVVIDGSPSFDPADPNDKLGVMEYAWTCFTVEEADETKQGEECFPNSVNGTLPYVECQPEVSPITGENTKFNFRGQWYDNAQYVTTQVLSTLTRYCMTNDTLVIQRNFLDVGEYMFTMNISKNISNSTRTASMKIFLQINQEDTRQPLVHIISENSEPFVASSPMRFIGMVTNMQNETSYTWKWTIFMYGLNPQYDIDLATTQEGYDVMEYTWVPLDESAVDFDDPRDIRSPPNSRFLVTVPNLLSPGVQYKIRLEATDTVMLAQGSNMAMGFAEVRFTMSGGRPSGGRLVTTNLTGIEFDTVFHFSLTGWGSEDLPLSYQFGYINDPQDIHAQPTMLSATFSQERTKSTRLPAGVNLPDYRVQVLGWTRSFLGSTTRASVEVSVRPNPNLAAARERLFQDLYNLEPETALIAGTMLAQTTQPNSPELLRILLGYELQAQKITDFPRMVPITPEMSGMQAKILHDICVMGMTNQTIIYHIKRLVDHGIEYNLLSVRDSDKEQGVNLVSSLMNLIDAMAPGQPPTPVSAPIPFRLRRLGGTGRFLARVIDTRTPDMQYVQFTDLNVQRRTLMNWIVPELMPGELAANYSLRGQDVYAGKDYVRLDETSDSSISLTLQNAFTMPSLDMVGGPDVYAYQYVEWKKFPYIFMDDRLPANRLLKIPSSGNFPTSGTMTEQLVPNQGFRAGELLWHSMTLELFNQTGGSVDEVVRMALANASFSMLPNIQAHHNQAFHTLEHSSTCYAVDLADNLTDAKYDNKGVVYNDNSCVTQKLSDFVIFVDDLPKELSFTDSYSDEISREYTDEYRTLAMITSLVLAIVGALTAASIAFYVDESQHGVTPIDLSKSRVVDLADPREKLIGTVTFNFRRNHLLVGMGQRHRKLTREKRVFALLVMWLTIMTLNVLFHTKLQFKGETQFVATGLVAGVLSFPLLQFVQFLYEWRPESRILPTPPPTSKQPLSIPLKVQAHMPMLKAPAPPPVPTRIMPPPVGAPNRRGTGALALPQLALPVLPPGLQGDLHLQIGDRTLKITPPPRVQRRTPRPPKEPPPADYLTATGSFGGLGSSKTGPFGLTLPQLPELPAAKIPAGRAPPPPPKHKGMGPKPPKAPPPVSKMFFTVPGGAPGSMLPPLAPLKAGPPSTAPKARPPPTLPPLPKLMRSAEALSLIKAGGGSSRAAPPPPPPPPPKGPPPRPGLDLDLEPQAPETPRSGDQPFMMTLPGSMVSADATTPLELTPRSGRTASPLGSTAGSAMGATLRQAAAASPSAPGAASAAGLRQAGAASPAGATAAARGASPATLRQAGAASPAPKAQGAGDFEMPGPPGPAFSEDPEHTMMRPAELPGEMPGPRPPSGLPRPPPLPPGPGQAGRTPTPPKGPAPPRWNWDLQGQDTLRVAGTATPPEGWFPKAPSAAPMPSGAPPLPPLPAIGDTTQVPLFPPPPAPMRSVPPSGSASMPTLRPLSLGGRDRTMLPPLPKLQLLPPNILTKVPSIQPHKVGMPPPPPPPRPHQPLQPGEMPLPPEDGEPSVTRRLTVFKGDKAGIRRGDRPPKPPPPKSKEVFKPTPPSGPPPAHAYILARKGAGDIDEAELIKKARPIGEITPRPPDSEPPPGLTRKAVPPEPPRPGGPPGGPALKPVKPGQPEEPEPLKKQFLDPPVEPNPVPDWVVALSSWMVNLFMLGLVIECCLFIIIYGVYMEPNLVWATHGATIVGVIVNLGLFESVKCIVVACVALIKDETAKRQAEIAARRARMALKAQRLQDKSRRWRQDMPLPSLPPPPLLG